jgi:2-polyprenyl-3-methyl-5-hydroxy-6-metoxy-1,4-benzoquinol methylase
MKTIYIWGAGHYGTLAVLDIEKKGLHIAGFIDGNKELQGKTKFGYEVFSPEQVVGIIKNIEILIAINNKEMIEQISKKLKTCNIHFEIFSLIVKQQQFEQLSLSTKEAFTYIYKNNLWASAESRSGEGSHIKTTKKLRDALPELWKKYSIKTFLDAPCGDYNWMKEINKDGIEYSGIDIVEELIDNNKRYESKNVSFKTLDITTDELPRVDMILCKDCLQHLSFKNVHKVLNNFKKSGSKYLLATSYSLTKENKDIKNGGYAPLNLFIEPFNLKEPLYYLLEEHSEGVEIDKAVYLFELAKN